MARMCVSQFQGGSLALGRFPYLAVYLVPNGCTVLELILNWNGPNDLIAKAEKEFFDNN
jgi:hypothetical protein